MEAQTREVRRSCDSSVACVPRRRARERPCARGAPSSASDPERQCCEEGTHPIGGSASRHRHRAIATPRRRRCLWNSDGWDGYAYERDRLFEDFAATAGDVVVLTGDVHSSWANELVPDANPVNAPVGVEFVAPAASTRPFASNVAGATPVFEAMFTAANPWIKQVDMDANGFLVLDLDHDRAAAQWFQVPTNRPGAPSSPLMAWQTLHGTNRLLPLPPH